MEVDRHEEIQPMLPSGYCRLRVPEHVDDIDSYRSPSKGTSIFFLYSSP